MVVPLLAWQVFNRFTGDTVSDNETEKQNHFHPSDTMNHSPNPENAPAIVAHSLADTLSAITQQPHRIPPDPPLTTPPPKINPYDTLSVVVVVLAFSLFAFGALIGAAILVFAAKS